MKHDALAVYCRSLSTLLQSGVSLLKSFEIAGNNVGGMRRVTERVLVGLRRGADVASTLRAEGSTFPPLMIDMVAVAEQAGALPEVLIALADHYENLVRLRKSFIGAISFPLFQLIAAIFVIAGLIWLLGMFGGGEDGMTKDPLGMGLVGDTGALIWLGGWLAVAVTLALIYLFVTRVLAQQAFVHSILLKVPVLGHCMQSFAVARFAWAYALTQESGMKVGPSLQASLSATGNGAFAASANSIQTSVMSGADLSTAMGQTGLFPQDFLEMMVVGETSGTVPETLKRISPILEDKARRTMSALTATFGWIIWTIVSGLIIFIIFRVFSNYLQMLDKNMPVG